MRDTGSMSNLITVDLYDGAYGPTIRVDVQARAGLLFLRDAVKALADGSGSNFEIVSGDRFALSGVAAVHMAAVEDDAGLGFRRMVQGKSPTFTWTLDRDAWRRCLGLVDGLVVANRPGHQYLTAEGEDDALVELAFMEGPGRPQSP
jgi:hypothetical protein